ncbi:FAD-dependent oxidoreductase [Sphingobium algorifonticola]|uniref:D-amino-acid oxidase n=1 Tax=Sphingobium algorifonticola TaxID=2008318 RepID=A0A437J8P0_9SPHN|nr:FAD-dependent oxidoreductase [Sphingobium algorifonticola]RVT41864.1 FAD-dependent oxidoreductase [Sphingobium algorifonticola]
MLHETSRRRLLTGGLATLAGLPFGGVGRASTLFDPVPPLIPIRALPDRIFRTTVCLRPFRAAGPRIESERVGRKLVVHNYGHGGSGWSLSWGSAEVAVRLAMQAGDRDIAVIGAGALGLTAALTAQRAGARVTIYTKDQFPNVRSAWATGTWSPDSRVAMANAVDAGFADRWEAMTRRSFATFQSYLGAPGDPVEWTDRYTVSDLPPEQARGFYRAQEVTGFLHMGDRIADISPRSQLLPPGSHPFPTPTVMRNSGMSFNIAMLARQLTADFLMAGGRIEPVTFFSPTELTRLKQKTIINCTGYGARALWADESIVPVRGQIAWLIPQAGVTYGLNYKSVSVLARRDGIVVQDMGPNDGFGFNDTNETVDIGAAFASVALLAELYERPVPAVSPRTDP